MFQSNGNWKEFGFSNDEKHTWFPFWLYCIVSAFVSYALSYFLNSFFGDHIEEVEEEVEVKPVAKRAKAKKTVVENPEMKSGYYVLDKESYEENGIPKYIFLGSNKPNENE